MVPYADIDTVFLDVGNTLISIDFAWVAAELAIRGFTTTPEVLRRAEAAARPGFSHRLFVEGVPPGTDVFREFLDAMLTGTDATAPLPADVRQALITDLRAVLRPDGKASTLWRSVMPRVPEALARLRDLGLTLAVVSNSDGTVEHSLEEAGLRSFMSVVIDSAVVGHEKPDERIFRAALDASGAQPARTLHVGDIYHADVVGARAAGLHVVMLDPYGDWPPLDVDHVPDLWAVADRLEAARAASGAPAAP